MSKLYIYNTSSIIKYMSSESGGFIGDIKVYLVVSLFIIILLGIMLVAA